jgi:hypothetical protein
VVDEVVGVLDAALDAAHSRSSPSPGAHERVCLVDFGKNSETSVKTAGQNFITFQTRGPLPLEFGIARTRVRALRRWAALS